MQTLEPWEYADTRREVEAVVRYIPVGKVQCFDVI
jgi:hypothetical protein